MEAAGNGPAMVLNIVWFSISCIELCLNWYVYIVIYSPFIYVFHTMALTETFQRLTVSV